MPHNTRAKRNEYSRKRRAKIKATDPERYSRMRVVEDTRLAKQKLDPEKREYYIRTATCKLYGISVKEYDGLLVEQNGVCAICRRPELMTKSGKTVRLGIDHNHQTGKVRGLLCYRCNRAVGLLKDDPLRAMAVADYLVRHGDVGN